MRSRVAVLGTVLSGLLAQAQAAQAAAEDLTARAASLSGPALPGALLVVVGLLIVAGVCLRREATRRANAERALELATVDVDTRVEQRAQEIVRQRTASSLGVETDRLASVSHELRTPLNAIVGWVEILKIDEGTNRARAIEAIERNAFIEARLIAQLLDIGPARDTAAAPAHTPRSESTAADATHRPSDLHLRVLVVEDDADAAVTLQSLLEQRGCDVRVARSMAEGVQAFANLRPDILLCDIGLPDGDGCTLLRLVRARDVDPPVPAIALSAVARDEDRARAAAAGFAVYMTKPYRLEELVSYVRRVAAKA